MKIVVSACLLGENCKYNGGNNFNNKVAELCENNDVIKICPEVLADAGTPRIPVEIKNGRLVNKNGLDVHEQYMNGVQKAIDKIKYEDIEMVVLQSRSPTCGVRQVYNGEFNRTLIDGKGVFAQSLIELGYNVVDVEDL